MFFNFIEENFFYLHPGYTTFNTIIFGIVLGLIILAIIKIFEKLDKNPKDLVYVLIPIIFFGSSSRALVDNHIYPRIHLLATPGIYIAIGLFVIFLLIFSVYLERNTGIKYTKTILIVGLIICIPNVFLLAVHGINVKILLFELLCFIIISSPFVLLRNRWKLLKNPVNLSVLLAHILDATSTFVAVDFFNYSEQHVLPTFLINLSNSAIIMYPLKIIIILVIIYVIDYYIDDVTSNNMLKLAIFILGLAPAIRNMTTLILSII